MKTKLFAALTLTALLLVAAPNAHSDSVSCKSDLDCDDGIAGNIDMCNHWTCKHYEKTEPPAPGPDVSPIVGDDDEDPINACPKPLDACFTNPSSIANSFVRKKCEASLEIVASNPTTTAAAAFCCFITEGDVLPDDVWEQMKVDCGLKKKPVITEKTVDDLKDKCSILVEVSGDISDYAQVNVCCNVVNNSGTLSDVEQACSNTSFLPGVPAKTPDSSEAAPDAPNGSDTADKDGDAAVSPATDNLHVAGGTGGCSLIR